jgi:3-oxoacyl-[acyl-carrier protein] reductase
VIHTPFLDTQPPEVVDYMTAKIPMGRTGTADEASTMLTWMISPACSFTTGFTFDLSGGRATY